MLFTGAGQGARGLAAQGARSSLSQDHRRPAETRDPADIPATLGG